MYDPVLIVVPLAKHQLIQYWRAALLFIMVMDAAMPGAVDRTKYCLAKKPVANFALAILYKNKLIFLPTYWIIINP